MRGSYLACRVVLAAIVVAFGSGCSSSRDTQEGVRPEPNPLTQNPWVPSGPDPSGPQCGDIDHKLAGTLEGSGKKVGLIAGVSWGGGTLTLTNGEQYQFSFNGFKLLDVSAASIEFTGKIYNLSRIEDLIGTYYGSSGSLGLVVGEGEVIANNSRCVVITAQAKGEGILLSPPGPGGFTLQLAPDE